MKKSGGGGSLLAARSKGSAGFCSSSLRGALATWQSSRSDLLIRQKVKCWFSKTNLQFLHTYSPTNLLTSRAFTLAEVVVVMGILTVMMAAFAPVLTKKTINPGSHNKVTFDVMPSHTGIYYGSQTDTKPVVIGDNKTDAGMTFNPKLLIVANDAKDNSKLSPHIGFALKNNDENLSFAGQLLMEPFMDSSPFGGGNLVLGGDVVNYTKGSSSHTKNTLVGLDSFFYNGNTVKGTAIGFWSSVISNGTAVGAQTRALGDYTTVIGTDSIAEMGYSTVLGGNAITMGKYATLAGYGTTGNNYSAVLGALAKGNGSYTTSVGYGACQNSTGSYSVCLGAIAGPTSSSSTMGIYIGTANKTYGASNIFFGNQTLGTLISSVTSDRRLKNVGKEYVGGLEELSKLKFYNYTLKDDKEKTPQVGVIAQDLRKVLPSAVFKDSDGYLKVRRDHLFFAALNAIKTLFNRITELEKRNAELEKRLEKLEKMLSEK